MEETHHGSFFTPVKLDVFAVNGVEFFLEELPGILEKYPFLEFPHKQSFYMLLYVEHATGEVTIDKEKIKLDQPKFVLIKPGYVCSLSLGRSDRGKLFCFTDDFFSLRYNENILGRFSVLQPNACHFIRISEEEKKHLNNLSVLIKREYDARQPEQRKVLRSYLNILLFELDRLYSPQGNVLKKTGKKEKVNQFEHLIDNHFLQKRLPSEYADILNISTNYLNKICKEVVGISAGEMIRSRVILESKRMLQYTNKTVKEVSFSMGFESVSYFITFFGKQTGMPPEQFRKMSN